MGVLSLSIEDGGRVSMDSNEGGSRPCIIEGLRTSGLTHEMYIPTYQFGNTLTMCFRRY